MGAYTLEFVDSDLVAGKLTLSHGLSVASKLVSVIVMDNYGRGMDPGIIVYDSEDSCVVDMSSYQPIDGTWTASASSPSSQDSSGEVAVKSVSDLPEAVDGVITLSEDVVYRVSGKVDVGSARVVASDGCALLGRAPAADGLLGEELVVAAASGASFSIEGLSLESSSSSVSLFDLSSLGAGRLDIADCYLRCRSLGSASVASGGLLRIAGSSVSGALLGLSVAGTGGWLELSDVSVKTEGGSPGTASLAALSGSFLGVRLTDARLEADSSIRFLFDIPPTVSASGGILRGSLCPAGSVLRPGSSQIQPSALRWTVRDNTGMADTREAGSMRLSACSTLSAAAGVWTKVEGTWSARLAERFSVSDGALVYGGTLSRTFEISVHGSVDASDGSEDKTVEIGIYRNGALLSEGTGATRTWGVDDLKAVSASAVATLSQGDSIEVYARNKYNADPFKFDTLYARAM